MKDPVAALPGWQRILLAVSLANLACLRLWILELKPTGYFDAAPRTLAMHAATGLVAGAAAAFAVVLERASAEVPRARRAAFVALLLAAVLAGDAFRQLLVESFADGGARIVNVAFLALVAALLALAVRVPGRAASGVTRALLVMSPFAAMTWGQLLHATVRSLTGASAREFAAASAPLEPRPDGASRLVVLLFDELDHRETFGAPAVELPAFAGFASNAVVATQARTPSMWTMRAVPSLLTGERVVATHEAGASDRRLVLQDGRTLSLREAPTLFKDARARGRNVAAGGWYHPYCRVFGGELARCMQRPYAPPVLPDEGFAEAVTHAVVRVFDKTPYFHRFHNGDSRLTSQRELTAAWHAESAREIHAFALDVVADPRQDLVYVHYPVPHGPSLDVRGNVLLADRLFGELRERMEAAGLWDSSSVLVLGDHPKRDPGGVPAPDGMREGEIRSPGFAWKPAHSRAGAAATRPFETLVLRRFAGRVLDGEIRSADDAVRFLDGEPIASADPH